MSWKIEIEVDPDDSNQCPRYVSYYKTCGKLADAGNGNRASRKYKCAEVNCPLKVKPKDGAEIAK